MTIALSVYTEQRRRAFKKAGQSGVNRKARTFLRSFILQS